jgi:RNA polymerase sigma factor (sigma-70 family)
MAAELINSVKRRDAHSALPSVQPPSAAFILRLAPQDEVLFRKLCTEPIDFVPHPDFEKSGLDQTLYGVPTHFVDDTLPRFVEPEPIRAAESKGSRVPTLSHEQEKLVFLRYNYARYRVARILNRSAGRKLTPSSARRLLAWGRRALDARTTIVRMNLPLVLAMAKRTRLSNIDFNELVSEGNMALLRSVEKFDCGRGFKFSTYSCRAILKSFSRVAMRASRYRGQFPMEFDPALERSDYVESKRALVEGDCVDELKEILIRNLAELSDVERTVIRERFAIGRPTLEDAPGPKTLEQVGHIIGVTKERVRQIQNKALRKIRGALEDRYLAA